MARAREFDDNAVLDAATDRFWRQGYAATSVRDLGDCMGLGAASLYNAFGDKRALFARCLDRYLDANMRERIARHEARNPPRAAIEAFLAESVERSLADRRGCLLVNTAIELGRSDPQVAELLDTYYARIESAFAGLIRRGQETGAIRGDLDPLVMARWLRVTGQGLSVSSRIGLVPGDLADVVRMALSPPNDQANNQEGERG